MTHEQDDAKIAARWLGIWSDGKRCHGGSREVEWAETRTETGALSSGATIPVGPKIPCIHGEMNAHDIPPPDFADPAVYDRALRELAERLKFGLIEIRCGMGVPKWSVFLGMRWGDEKAAAVLGTSNDTIGAAIAAAIAELARAEGTNDADMEPHNRKLD